MKIAVVGLGPAGCRAALALADAGRPGLLFDAQDRVGGRLHTVRLPNGLSYEAGGEWIDADHERILGLLARFGQEPVPSDQRPGRAFYDGEWRSEDDLWPDATIDEAAVEEQCDYDILDLDPVPWDNLLSANLDTQNVADYLHRHAKSPRGRWWVRSVARSDEGEEPERISLLGWLVNYMHYVDRDPGAMSRFRFPEGAQGFCERMLAAAGSEPQLGNPLRKVSWSDDSALLTFERGLIAVDAVILAMPPSALGHIEFDPALPESMEDAIDLIPMSRTLKISLAFRERWWLDHGFRGRMMLDTPLGQGWDGTLGEMPVLNFYVCGDGAAHYSESAEPVQEALQELSRKFPEAEEHFVSGAIHNWMENPYAGGGFPYTPPGTVLANLQTLRQPIGCLHFAGDHSADWMGFIEGALESGERAAAEVLAKQ
ncbi:MAG: FAD-dependent oxidoreductase [Chthonomonas sp.]|nr:FAD-dependent oxidoreductase [Chthonomonas sp.]